MSKLESLQLQFCRVVLGQKNNRTAGAGLRSELGLCSLKARRVKLRLGFWSHLCRADPSRLMSVVFRRRHAEVLAGGARLSGLRHFKDALVQQGLGFYWDAGCISPGPVEEWKEKVDSHVMAREREAQLQEMHTKPSLRNYVRHCLPSGDRVPVYLQDRSNVQGRDIMAACRLGSLDLMPRIAQSMKWPESRGRCMLCGQAREDVGHFLLDCPVLRPCRAKFEDGLRHALVAQGPPGIALLSRFSSCRDSRLGLLLGSGPRVLQESTGLEACREQGARACWQLDKMAKNYLVACWRARQSIMGVVSVTKGVLKRDPPPAGTKEVLSRQSAGWKGCTPAVTAEHRKFWEQWLPKDETGWSRSGRRGPANFYVVHKGRRTGIFYKWSDCMRSVAGCHMARFQGFMSLENATMAARPTRRC